MKNEDLIDVANSYKIFDTMYDLLKFGDYSFLNRECGTMNYPEIKWMLEYFTEKEEYRLEDWLEKFKIAIDFVKWIICN